MNKSLLPGCWNEAQRGRPCSQTAHTPVFLQDSLHAGGVHRAQRAAPASPARKHDWPPQAVAHQALRPQVLLAETPGSLGPPPHAAVDQTGRGQFACVTVFAAAELTHDRQGRGASLRRVTGRRAPSRRTATGRAEDTAGRGLYQQLTAGTQCARNCSTIMCEGPVVSPGEGQLPHTPASPIPEGQRISSTKGAPVKNHVQPSR